MLTRSEEELFAAAIQKPPHERSVFLEQACGADAQLRAHVESLVAAHEQPDSLLDGPASDATLEMALQITERVGTMVGPYKLREQIGEGGMGIVYVAEQERPIRRNVALKVIKPGMDTRQVIARFEAERQALALMDHPNIARVFDGGATEAGRPYFVMELVRGVPITDYCDQNNLSVHERLELFVTVCHAVQHAHQKGIIHRDIKPTNVLVTLHDGRAIPKVIDFGVAKAIDQQLTDKTLFTQFAQMVGTPLYMSPEQAELTGLDIDTRCDIYSLGVMLYELLTGTTPFDSARMKKVALEEIRRIIREEDPPSPSTRLSSTAGETQTAVAVHRHVDPKGLSRLVRGDLDWIVMKALEKERNRRYETASGFAADIVRYLSDEPVEACPPSATYRFRKFVRRNRGPVLAAVFVLATLLFGIAGTTIGLLKVRAERDKVVAAQEKERLALIEAEKNFQTARDAVDIMYTRAAEEMRDKPQVEQIRRKLLEDALRFYQGFLKQKRHDPAIRYEAALTHRRVGEIYAYLGDWKSSLDKGRTATAALGELAPHFGNDAGYRDELARAHFHNAYALFSLLHLEDCDDTMQQVIPIWESLTREFPDQPSYLEDLARANTVLGLAWIKNYSPKANSYMSRGRELLARLKQRFPKHQISSAFQYDLKTLTGSIYEWLPHDQSTLLRLEQDCRNELAAAEAEVDAHPDAPDCQKDVAQWMTRLCNVLSALDRFEDVEPVARRILDISQRLVIAHPLRSEYKTALAWIHHHTGHLLRYTDRPDEAVAHFRRAIAIAGELAEQHPENARAQLHLAQMIRDCPVKQLRNPERAIAIYQQLKQSDDSRQTDAELSLAHVQAGRYREALQSCQSASTTGASVVEFARALAYWHLGRQDEGRELMRQVLLLVDTQPNRYWFAAEYRSLRRDVAMMMGLDTANLRTSNPEAVLRNATSLYQKLAAERPGDAGLAQELAGRYKELAQLLSTSGRSEEGEQLLVDAAASYAQLARDHAAVPQYRDLQSRAHFDLGLLQQQRGRNQEAERNYRQAFAIWTNLAEDVPKEPYYRFHAANVLTYQLTQILTTGKHVTEAEQTIRQGMSALETLVVEFPDRNDFRRNLGEAYGILSSQYIAAQRSAEAEQLCTKALERWPDHPFILVGRARSHLALKQPEKALPDFSKAIEVAPNDSSAVWWYLDRANVYAALAQPEKQLADLTSAVGLGPGVADTWLGRGWYYANRNEQDLAFADFSKAVEVNPKHWATWSSRGWTYASKGQWEQAVADLTKALEIDQGYLWTWYERARSYSALRQWDQAISDYAKAIELGVNLPEARLDKAKAHENLEQWDEAFADYAKLIERHPGQLAAVLAQIRPNGRPDDEPRHRSSLEWFDKQIERLPSDGALRAGRGRAYLALKQFDQALVDLSKATESAPNHGDAPWWSLDLATAYRGLRQTGQARAELSRAIELWPNLWDARVWRADFHRDLHESDAAVADYSKALELNPNYAPAWQSRASCYAHLGQWDRALADYTKVVELNPQSADAHNNLAWLLATCADVKFRDPRSAVESAKKSVELAPAAGTFWNTLGVAHYRAGNWQASIDALTKSNELLHGKQMSFNGFFLAMALWQLDKQDEAREWFDMSTAWMDANTTGNAELIRSRAEASELLGSSKED